MIPHPQMMTMIVFFWLNLLLGDDGDDDEDVDIEAVCVQRGQEDHS